MLRENSPSPEVEKRLVINKNGLISDALNIWMGREWITVVESDEADEQLIIFLKSRVQTYEEYLHQYESRYPGITERTLANPLTNKASVDRFNQLANEYNTLAHDLKANSERIFEIVKEARELTAQN